MDTIKFKTNIKCTGCLSQVNQTLNEVAGEDQWNVDLMSSERILSVTGDTVESEIIAALKQAGFNAERIKQ